MFVGSRVQHANRRRNLTPTRSQGRACLDLSIFRVFFALISIDRSDASAFRRHVQANDGHDAWPTPGCSPALISRPAAGRWLRRRGFLASRVEHEERVFAMPQV